jgi:hypothetical protein
MAKGQDPYTTDDETFQPLSRNRLQEYNIRWRYYSSVSAREGSIAAAAIADHQNYAAGASTTAGGEAQENST